MEGDVRTAIETTLHATIREARPISGGDISDAYALELADGQRLFAKTRRNAPAGMFAAEARGLEWLRSAFVGAGAESSLTVPQVLATGEGGPTSFLVLELLQPGRRRSGFDEHLGRGLAHLHRAGAAGFGFDADNFIGPLAQSNRAAASWPEFYRRERLLPQLALPNARRLLGERVRRRFEHLLDALEEWVGPHEGPARLHGDLWGGNLHVTAAGTPALIDPAVYGGHREMDLAMMRLFGGFSQRTFEAYAEAFPLASGHEERVSLWQLYPLLVHVNLFGGSYVSRLAAALERYA